MTANKSNPNRCGWATNDLSIQITTANGACRSTTTASFEFLILEGAQAGLKLGDHSRKRDYRAAFDGFDPKEHLGALRPAQDAAVTAR